MVPELRFYDFGARIYDQDGRRFYDQDGREVMIKMREFMINNTR